MQSVSNRWISTQEQLITDECFIEIAVEFTDPEAIYTANVEAEPELEILSDITSVLQKNNICKYGTLETNLWLLDGSTLWANETGNDIAGYISESVSSGDSSFPDKPIITITPAETASNIYGITITFSESFEEYAKDFTVSFYLNGAEVSSKAVTDNDKIICPVQISAESYDEIKITINSWCLPYRRARIENITMGYKRKFEKNSLFNFNIEQVLNPLNAVLPENLLNFSIDCTKENDTELQKYFRRGQKINVLIGMYVNGGGKEMINGGMYYLDTWDFEKSGLKGNLTGKSLIYFLNQIMYTEGKYSAEKTSLYQLAKNVLEFASENSKYEFKWYLSQHLTSIMTSAPLPVCSVAECLQLIAQAGGCTLICGRDNTIKILKTSYSGTSQKYEVKDVMLLDYPKIQLQTELSTVKCSVFAYTLKDEITLHRNAHYVDGTSEIIIQHEESGEVSGTITPSLASESIEVVSENYFASYSKIVLSGNGYAAIEIKGRPIESSTFEYSMKLSDEGSEETISNPLIDSETNAKIVCESAISWLQNRNQEEITLRADPRLDAGDFAYYDNEDILIHNVKYEFTGMFRGTLTGRIGYEDFVAPDSSEAGFLNDEIWPDLNGDGKADSRDATIISQAALDIAVTGSSGLTPEQEIMADANRDGEIKANDSALVLLFASMVGTGDYEQSPSEWVRFLKNEGIIV